MQPVHLRRGEGFSNFKPQWQPFASSPAAGWRAAAELGSRSCRMHAPQRHGLSDTHRFGQILMLRMKQQVRTALN
jgi:hypothetical protein